MDYMGSWENKDPNEKRLVGIDWSGDLAQGDTIATSEWSVVSGTVTLEVEDKTSTQVKVRVVGGVEGESARIKNTSTTVAGEVLEGTMRMDIRTR